MNLFVYGTLLVPKIWELVTQQKNPSFAPAMLPDHSIWRVKNAHFPAIIPESPERKASVPGHVHFDVPSEVLARLDRYEDTFYQRDSVIAYCDERRVKVEVYRVTREQAAHLLSSDPWTLEWFERHALDHYLEQIFGIS